MTNQYELGYAYPTSEIAEKFGHGKTGCGYIRAVDGLILYVFKNGIGDAMRFATDNGFSLTPESRAWAENILAIRSKTSNSNQGEKNA